MGIVSAKKMLLGATESRCAVGAFNVTDIIRMKAVVEAAQGRKIPLIVQTSVALVRFLGVKVLVAAHRALVETGSIPICLHLAHCTDVDLCAAGAYAGYTNVTIDASKANFEENIRIAASTPDRCHHHGDITVEGELGAVCGVEDHVKVTEDEAVMGDIRGRKPARTLRPLRIRGRKRPLLRISRLPFSEKAQIEDASVGKCLAYAAGLLGWPALVCALRVAHGEDR